MGLVSHRPVPWVVKPVPTVYMDFVSGRGVNWDGRPVVSGVSVGRKNPSLVDKLDAVLGCSGVIPERIQIVFTGKIPATESGQRHWLLVKTPGWVVDDRRGHWLGSPPTGRFVHSLTLTEVEVRTAGEWFGDTLVNPVQARDSFILLDSLLASVFGSSLEKRGRDVWGKSLIMQTPARTGTNLWAASMPKFINPVPVAEDIAEELHLTSTQHHLDHLVSGPGITHDDVVPLIDSSRGSIDGFSYVDGRFMYGSLCREIGMGPGVRKKKYETYELLEKNPYVRARIKVRFTVPDGWNHVGVFGLPHQDVGGGWYYPNRPGASGVTWADASEVMVAINSGWRVEPLESVVFNERMSAARTRGDGGGGVSRGVVKARPLDDWADKLKRAREMVAADESIPPVVRQAVGAGLRAIVIQTIGAFASRGRGATGVVDDPKDVPGAYADTVRRQGTRFVYTISHKLSRGQLAYYHPEYAVQVWGRGRAKVLMGRANGHMTGALTLPGSSIIGINGDAIYSTTVPQWSRPVADGGADDGKTGRLRLQGFMPGPVPVPVTRADRDRLKAKAIAHGVEVEDRAGFAFEWNTPADDAAAYKAGVDDE